MSYRVDIPTLSANEVYTLTFEYGGTETIQLVVGDLTLETTDRRVVFTTTSPVNYIESNVNLTNLNMYEGYYESDDFGGEYTKESYLKGATLINLVTRNMYDSRATTSVTREFTEDGFRKITITGNGSQYLGGDFWAKVNFVDKSIPEDWNTVYTVIVFVRKNTFPNDISLQFNMRHKNIEGKGEHTIIIKGGDTGIYKATSKIGSYNQSLPVRYWGCFATAWSDTDVAVVDRTDLVGCVFEYAVMVVKGDYYDDNITIGHFFEGIGCVKSPKIVSQTEHQNVVITDIFKLSGESSSGATFDKETQTVTVTGSARYTYARFYFQPQKWGYEDYSNMCVEFDVVEIGKLKDGDNPYFSLGQHCTALAGYSSTTFLYEGDHVKVAFSTSSLLDVRSSLIAFNTNGSTGGINNKLVITNFTMYHIDDLDGVGTYDYCKVSTPDDLELYKVNDTTYDKLDLTTGILYKNTGTYVLDETFVDRTSNWDIDVHATTGNVTFTSRQHSYLRDEHNFPYSLYNNAIVSNADPASNIVNNNNIEITRPRLYFDVYSNNNYTVIIMPASYNVTTLEELRTWLQNNPMIFNYKLGTPYTEQLSLNPLKSYRNGSIQTSSQQLTPTLKTTLPISNKFTTTNLTSGSTYNVYFDGTATKLDAGGTIITNPVSPCEVECGGTTLTIEGTDIQNVRVIETTVKNEVGSVCGKTDVELSRIKTKCAIHNMFDDYFQGSHNTNWAKDYYCTSTRDDTTVKIVGKSSLNYAGYSLVAPLPFGTYKLHYKVKVSTIGDKYKVALSSNPNGTPQDAYVPVTDVTSTALVEEQTFVFYKKHITNMLFYTYRNGQEIEYYDISLIKLSDEDITGTDTSNINYSQVISDLEQPIKLRSLGTTHDNYNPVTGELVKRIGVSETDGSYSVLSSPIVSQVEIDNIPHLYTNGQVKVYSDSEVYPTTILNGQSTNNYEINELNKSNNYTIRYDGECESINLAKKSNTQGTNRIVKAGANGSGNLTFVNDNGDIDNVLLTQGDVREQEINHFNGLQAVEVSGMLIETSQNMWWNDWIEPSQYDASWFVDSADYIQVNGGEIIYIVAKNREYYSIVEFDENYTKIKFSNILITNPQQQDITKNGYYKNFLKLRDNTRYIKFVAPKSSALAQTSNPTFTFSKIELNEPILSANIPYQCVYIDLPQPVQLNSLPDGTCDTYNPITGKYVQNVGVAIMDENGSYGNSWSNTGTAYPVNRCTGFTTGDMATRNSTVTNVLNNVHSANYGTAKDYEVKLCGYGDRNTNYKPVIDCGNLLTGGKNNVDGLKAYLKENPIILYYQLVTPITTQLTPIEIPTFEGGVLQLITTDGKVFPMIEYSMPTNNRYDTSSWEAGKVYTQRNMTEAYFNESTTPMTPTETMTLTTDHISSGSIILNDNGNGLIVLKGNYTGRDIPYFTGMRSVESIEVEVTPSPNQPLFGKGGRK